MLFTMKKAAASGRGFFLNELSKLDQTFDQRPMGIRKFTVP